MAVDKFEAPYALIISTNSYAGNFERQLCAYVTGAIGECGVGDDLSKIFFKEENEVFFDIVNEGDDHGCYRPVSIYDDKDKYKSLVIFFDSEPTDEDMAIIIRRTKDFCQNRPDWDSHQEKIPLVLKGIKLIKNEIVQKIITVKRYEYE